MTCRLWVAVGIFEDCSSGSFNVNNFVTTFRYIEEDDNIGDENYIQNDTSFKLNENSSILFSTRRNRKIDLTEYYNLILDRWYYAKEAENIWLSFDSSDRNKVDEETYLYLKSQHGIPKPVIAKNARYKIIAIENEAPNFIKTDYSFFFLFKAEGINKYFKKKIGR